MARMRLLIQVHPALDVLGSSAQNHALNAVPRHEIETPLAATDDRLPCLHWQVEGTRHQGDLLELIPPVRHRRRERIVLALMGERRLIKSLHDDLELFFKQLPIGVGILHRCAKRFDLARMIPPPDPKDDPATRQNIRHGKILCEAQGMPHGEHIEAAAEFEPGGVLGQPETEHEEVRNALIPLTLEMVLGHPENVIAQRLHALGGVFGNLKSLDKPLVGIPAVIGGYAAKTYAFAFKHMAGIERREIANHGLVSFPPHTYICPGTVCAAQVPPVWPYLYRRKPRL